MKSEKNPNKSSHPSQPTLQNLPSQRLVNNMNPSNLNEQYIGGGRQVKNNNQQPLKKKSNNSKSAPKKYKIIQQSNNTQNKENNKPQGDNLKNSKNSKNQAQNVVIHQKLKSGPKQSNNFNQFNDTSKITLMNKNKDKNTLVIRKLSQHQFSVDQEQESKVTLSIQEDDEDIDTDQSSIIQYPKKQQSSRDRLSNAAQRQNKNHPILGSNLIMISDQKPRKRQSNSYCKPPQHHNQSERNDEITFHNDSLNIFTHQLKQQDRQSERLRTSVDQDDSTMMDAFFEKKYKHAQAQVIQAKSKIYLKDSQIESLQSELRRQRRDLKLLEEKNKHLEGEVQTQTKKKLKYKHIAKQFKTNLEQIENTLNSLKTLSQNEINSLKSKIQSLDQQLRSKNQKYLNYMGAIEGFLNRIQKMIVPSDQNYGFNQKIIGDISELCQQMTKQTEFQESKYRGKSSSKYANEEYGSRKHQRQINSNDKSLVEMEFLISQSSNGGLNSIQDQMFSNKTKRLLDDYQKLRYDSEVIKQENQRLKQKIANNSLSLEKSKTKNNQQLHILSTYDSKESQNRRNQQNLSVGDLQQLDSVQLLNNKLEDQNKHLENQLQAMREEMQQLALQTRQMQNERENFRLQIQNQDQHISQIINQAAEVGNTSHESEKYVNEFKMNNHVSSQNQIEQIHSYQQDGLSDNYTTQYSQEKFIHQQRLENKTKRRDESYEYQNQYIDNQSAEQTAKLYNPYQMSTTTSDHHYRQNILNNQNLISFKQIDFNNLQQRPSELSSNIISSRNEINQNQDNKDSNLNSDRYSKQTLDSAQRIQYNVFKRTGLNQESVEKIRQKTQVDLNHQDRLQLTNLSNKLHNQQTQQQNLISLPNNKQLNTISSKIAQTTTQQKLQNNYLLSTSPNLSNLIPPLSSNRDTSGQNIFKNNQRMLSLQTLKRPTSMGSTTTLVMNEKAKALKDEILTLDDEIQQLQKNLKRAISKREIK